RGLLERLEGERLLGEILRVDKRHVEERPMHWMELEVVAAGDRLAGDGTRAGIHRKRCGLVAMHVPGELVEQDDEGERALRRGSPRVELPALRRRERGAEALGDLAIDLRAA